jgi:hypothetical protein
VLSPLIHLARPLNGKSVSRSSGFSSTIQGSWILARVTATGLEKLIPLQANYRTISEPVQRLIFFLLPLSQPHSSSAAFSSMNSASKARRTALSLGTGIEVCPSTSSARRIVATHTADA